MPSLNISEEDLDSLAVESLISPAAALAFLRYFINDDDHIAVHIATTTSQLAQVFLNTLTDQGRELTNEEFFRDIIAGERPIILRRTKHFVIIEISGPTGSRYIGLSIELDVNFTDVYSSCVITYIDPLGMQINQELKDQIETAFQAAFKKEASNWNYVTHTYIDHLTGEEFYEDDYESERKFDIYFDDFIYEGAIQASNELNSGLFLIYLLVCLKNNTPLISLKKITNKFDASKKIAEKLAEVFLSAYKNSQSLGKDPISLNKIALSSLMGPTNYQYEENPFRWQIQEQQEYFKELLNDAHSLGLEKFHELYLKIKKNIRHLIDDRTLDIVWQKIIAQLKLKIYQEILSRDDELFSFESYTQYKDDYKEKQRLIRERKEDDFEANYGGLDGADNQWMRYEEGLDSESGSEYENSSSTSSSSSSNEDDDYYDEYIESESSSSSSSSKRDDDIQDDSSESDDSFPDMVDDRFIREYSDDLLGDLEIYIDNICDDNDNYRFWARKKLEEYWDDSEDISKPLEKLFSKTKIDSMIAEAIQNSDLINLLFKNIDLVSDAFKEFINAAFQEHNFTFNDVRSIKNIILVIRTILNPIFLGNSPVYDSILASFSEPIKKELLFSFKDLKLDFIEKEFNKASERGDYIEMQAIWSVYSKYRKALFENNHEDIDLSLIQKAVDQQKKYSLRFYPSHKVTKISTKNSEYDLLPSVQELAKVARKTKDLLVEKVKKLKKQQPNIFIPKIVFHVQRDSLDKFIAIELDLNYQARLLSRHNNDKVMQNQDEQHKTKSREDSTNGWEILQATLDEIDRSDFEYQGKIQDIRYIDLSYFQCSERIFIELLKNERNLKDIVKLLVAEIIEQFEINNPEDLYLFTIDSINFLGFSSKTPCSLCGPALVWLQNSFAKDEPLGMLVNIINSFFENNLSLRTQGFNLESQTQDFTQLEINTIVYADTNSHNQADDLADNPIRNKFTSPEYAHNPKAKLILPNQAIDISKPRLKKSQKDDMYYKPYIIEYCGLIEQNLDVDIESTGFGGIACISGKESVDNAEGISDLFRSAHQPSSTTTSSPSIRSKQSASHTKKSERAKTTQQLNKSSLEDETLKEAKYNSRKDAETRGEVGPRELPNFDMEDVPDDGNCFYHAIANQMKIINHDFVHNVPLGTDPNNSLRLAIQRENFRDRQWADDQTFDQFVQEFPDVILAVINTGNPNSGFTLYYVDNDGEVITNIGDPSLVVPNDRIIIRIAATGNHFMSVRGHPDLENGAIHEAYSASEFVYVTPPLASYITNNSSEIYEFNDHSKPNIEVSSLAMLGITTLLLFTNTGGS